MPCNSDYLAATGYETNLSRVACLLDELDGKTWTKRDWDGYHDRVYSRHLSRLDGDAMVATLCHKLQSIDVTKYSLEMQIWWRDHQKADQDRMEKEDRFANAKRLISSIEEGRAHSQYAAFNLRDIARYVRHLEKKPERGAIMTETPIGLADIAGISTAEEGRAVALALFNQLPRWIEITDDPATWPPDNQWVVVRFGDHEYVAARQHEGSYLACMEGSFVTVLPNYNATHWRPI